MVYTRKMTGSNPNNSLVEWGGHSRAPSTSTAAPAAAAPIQCSKAPPPTATTTNTPSPTQSWNLLDLPPEILEKVIGYLPYKNVCQLRLVCRTIERICAQILNHTFLRLQNQMLAKFQEIKARMPRRESARRSHHLACESDIVETLHMRLNLLQMLFGKHIERKHICFFPGEILDEVYRILHYIKVTQKLDLPYRVTDELFDLSTMAMEYFKEKIEPNLPEIAFFSADFLKFTTNFVNPTSLISSEASKDTCPNSTDELEEAEDLVEIIPQSNMVLRKRIHKIKQGMKRYSSQLSLFRQDLRSCKRKTSEQQKQLSEQQKQISDQQKQALEYATRLDECDKKNEEISRKLSILLQELNKCKTELQYWRCKSPAAGVQQQQQQQQQRHHQDEHASVCDLCGNVMAPESPPPAAPPPPSPSLTRPDALVLDALEQVDDVNVHKQLEETKLKDKKLNDQPSTSSPERGKASKRMIEEEEPSSSKPAVKKVRRLSKVRGKRSKI